MQKITLSTDAIYLLRHVLKSDGKKIQDQGKEVFTQRALNGEESAQRRHLFKKTDDILNGLQKEKTEAMETHNKMVLDKRILFKKENPKNEAEEKDKLGDKLYAGRIEGMLKKDVEIQESLKNYNELLAGIKTRKFELELEQKTFDVCKKYFNEYSNEAGFEQSDDETAGELLEIFA